MSRSISINEATIAAIDRAAKAMANADEGLRGLNMTEGEELAGMFAALSYRNTAKRILATVWMYEDEDCRDPRPLLDLNTGERFEVAENIDAWPLHHETETVKFRPRPNGQILERK